MRQVGAAVGAFLFFFFFWAVLHSQSVESGQVAAPSKEKWYFGIVVLMGAVAAVFAGLLGLFLAIQGDYGESLRTLGPCAVLASISWKFRDRLWKLVPFSGDLVGGRNYPHGVTG